MTRETPLWEQLEEAHNHATREELANSTEQEGQRPYSRSCSKNPDEPKTADFPSYKSPWLEEWSRYADEYTRELPTAQPNQEVAVARE